MQVAAVKLMLLVADVEGAGQKFYYNYNYNNNNNNYN